MGTINSYTNIISLWCAPILMSLLANSLGLLGARTHDARERTGDADGPRRELLLGAPWLAPVSAEIVFLWGLLVPIGRTFDRST
jgi:hypothetical protein